MRRRSNGLIEEEKRFEQDSEHSFDFSEAREQAEPWSADNS